jgi:hypothetical protein
MTGTMSVARSHPVATSRRAVLSSGTALIAVIVLPTAAAAASGDGDLASSDSLGLTVDDDRDGEVLISIYEEA